VAVEATSARQPAAVAPDDSPAPIGRSRGAAALRGGLALSAHRGLALIVGLLMVPLAAHTLPRPEFGLWLLLSTIPALLGFLDLGLANGLVTLIATESARGPSGRAAIRGYVSSGAFLLAAMGLMIGAAIGVLVSVLDLRSAMGATSAVSHRELSAGLLVVVLSTALLVPLSVAQRVAQGLQRMEVVGVCGAVGAFVQLGMAAICTIVGAGFTWFVLASCIGGVVSAALAYVLVFYRLEPDLRPSRAMVDRAAARLVLRRGGLFFILGIAAAVGFQTDALVISNRLGVDQVARYAAPYRLFSLAPAAITLFALPLWAAHADAFARGETAWTRRMLRRSSLLAGIAVVGFSAVLVLVTPRTLSVTLGDADPHPSFWLLVALGVTAVVLSLSQPMAMLLNAANVVRFQVVIAILMCVTNLGLSIILVERIGVAGPAFGTAIAQTVCVLIPSVVYIRRLEGTHEPAAA
jgi:O-antigen/teichoic acid export membrane protein